MSGLPELIPPQSMPIGTDEKGEPLYLSVNWWLWLYNLSVAVLGTGGGGGSTPASPYDALDAADLLAASADIPQAFRGIANLSARLSLQPDGADVARLRHDLANAFVLASTPALVDPVPAAQPFQAVAVGASPFTYTAPFGGALAISGGTVSAISLIRQGISIACGMTSGLVPMRRLDQVVITWSVLPTVTFIPS